MAIKRLPFALALCALAGLAAVEAGAKRGPGAVPSSWLAQAETGITLEEATAQVRAETGGRILSAQTQDRGGEPVHRIKVLTDDNRVRIIEIDPRTGARR